MRGSAAASDTARKPFAKLCGGKHNNSSDWSADDNNSLQAPERNEKVRDDDAKTPLLEIAAKLAALGVLIAYLVAEVATSGFFRSFFTG